MAEQRPDRPQRKGARPGGPGTGRSTGPSAPPVPGAPPGYGSRPVIEWMAIESDDLTRKFPPQVQIAGQTVDQFRVTLPLDVLNSREFIHWLKAHSGQARID